MEKYYSFKAILGKWQKLPINIKLTMKDINAQLMPNDRWMYVLGEIIFDLSRDSHLTNVKIHQKPALSAILLIFKI